MQKSGYMTRVPDRLDGGVPGTAQMNEMMKAGDHCFCLALPCRAETNLTFFCPKSQVAFPIIEGAPKSQSEPFWPLRVREMADEASLPCSLSVVQDRAQASALHFHCTQ